jgi:hypothetical protein
LLRPIKSVYRRAENAAAIVAAAMRANGDAMNSLVPDLSETPPQLPHRGLPPVPFGPAPLIEGEDAAAYDEFLMRITCAVRPVDIFEEIWVRDIVDLVWEALRLRRFKASQVTAGARSAMAQLLAPRLGWPQAEGLARSWAAREPGALASVNEHLAVAGSGVEALAAQGLCIRLDNVERIDRMIMTAEARRNATLREIDRHRETLGRRLRQAVAKAEAQDATFEIVEAEPAGTGEGIAP